MIHLIMINVFSFMQLTDKIIKVNCLNIEKRIKCVTNQISPKVKKQTSKEFKSVNSVGITHEIQLL